MPSSYLYKIQRAIRASVELLTSRAQAVFAALVIALIALSLMRASLRCFWFDEIFTYYLNRLPSTHELWAALISGTDQMPIGFHLLTRWLAPPGLDPHVALRLPAVLGFGVMLVSVWVFVSRRLPQSVALLAAILPTITAAQVFAYEARAYGILLGCTALSLVCWQATYSSRYRSLALAGLWASLTVAIACHYYAILLLLPILVGEGFRMAQTRRVDKAVLVAVFGSCAVLVPLLPLIRSARSFSANHWSSPHAGQVFEYYLHLIDSITVRSLLAGAIVLGAARLLRRKPEAEIPVKRQLPAHEFAAVAMLGILPIPAVALGMVVTKAYTDRYALPAVIGMSILGALAFFRLMRDNEQRTAVMALVVAFFGIGFPLGNAVSAMRAGRRCDFGIPCQQAEDKFHLPVVYSSGLRFLPAYFYSPPRVRQDLFFLVDRNFAVQYRHTDSIDRLLPLLMRYEPLPVVEFEAFLREHPRFVVIEDRNPADAGWILSEAISRGYSCSLQESLTPDTYTFVVSAGVPR